MAFFEGPGLKGPYVAPVRHNVCARSRSGAEPENIALADEQARRVLDELIKMMSLRTGTRRENDMGSGKTAIQFAIHFAIRRLKLSF